jgi:hypothetical protein
MRRGIFGSEGLRRLVSDVRMNVFWFLCLKGTCMLLAIPEKICNDE